MKKYEEIKNNVFSKMTGNYVNELVDVIMEEIVNDFPEIEELEFEEMVNLHAEIRHKFLKDASLLNTFDQN